MQITGTVHKVLESISGQGSRGNWKKQSFIIKTKDQYPKEVCITGWGDIVDSIDELIPGTEVTVLINIESREYNDKWYTEVKALKIKQGDSQPQNVNDDSEQLPF